jgi:peptide/nickel transport system permease protein
MIIGSILGAVAGYFGRGVDEVIMRISDLVFAFPTIILAMIVAASLGPSLTNAVIALLIVSWPSYARVMRSMVLGERAREYVIAGRLLGATAFRSLGRDVLPNVAAPVLVLATLDFGNAILLLSGLSFLGLGATPPTPEWGSMVADGVQNFSAWWLAAFPGLAIFTVVMAFNFLGDAMRDALDPRSAGKVQGVSV